MKPYTAILFATIVGFITSCSNDQNKKDTLIGSTKRISLIEYFHALPTASMYINNETKHQLSYSNTSWITKAKGIDYSFPITVDPQNGYFELHDQGTGGGGHVIQIAKYINDHNREIVAVNSWHWNPVFSYYLGVRLFAFTEKGIIQITEKIFPKISIYSFITQSFSMKEYQNLKKIRVIGSVIGYKLPRIGTSIRCFVLKDYLKQFIHDRDDGILSSEKKLIRKFLFSIKRETLEIKWDSKKSIFLLSTSHNGG